MTIEQAERLSREYQRILADQEKRGSRRSPTLLPADKTTILQAMKLELAQLFYIHADANEDVMRPIVNAAMFIDSFDDLPMDASQFIQSMQCRRNEMETFLLQLGRIDRSTGFYWQRVYALVGIKTETKNTSFFENLKQKFTRRALHPLEETGTSFYRNPELTDKEPLEVTEWGTVHHRSSGGRIEIG